MMILKGHGIQLINTYLENKNLLTFLFLNIGSTKEQDHLEGVHF
jgi:hypothetical protein